VQHTTWQPFALRSIVQYVNITTMYCHAVSSTRHNSSFIQLLCVKECSRTFWSRGHASRDWDSVYPPCHM